MKDKKTLTEGDIFYVFYKGKYVFGRILLDVKRIIKKEPKHTYWFFGSCFLAEIYKGLYDEPKLATSEIILPSSFVERSSLNGRSGRDVDWIFYGNNPVNYKKLDFPETLVETNNIIYFIKGDVSLPVKKFPPGVVGKYDGSVEKYNPSREFSYYGLVEQALYLQGRMDLMEYPGDRFSADDLRFQEKDRNFIYNQINENINTPYYELALKHGFDLGRFYE
jgi:hypothetical protein